MHVAYELASRNNLSTRFVNGAAGKHWFSAFMKPHPTLSLRTAEGTSLGRATGFNKPQVMKFYDMLEKVIDDNKFTALNIYNVDDTGVSTVHTPPKLLAEKGKRLVASVTSAERGKNVTAVCCMSASGIFIPPMFIFPRVRMNMELMDGSPPGSVYGCQPKGWITEELFMEWMRHLSRS